jgi:hypothetical protein
MVEEGFEPSRASRLTGVTAPRLAQLDYPTRWPLRNSNPDLVVLSHAPLPIGLSGLKMPARVLETLLHRP